jgi:hypothetical protein
MTIAMNRRAKVKTVRLILDEKLVKPWTAPQKSWDNKIRFYPRGFALGP